MFEPGRMIVGNAGILVTRVIYLKHGDAKNFVVIDAAMNDLIRPTLYEAHHDILPVRLAEPGARAIMADVVGPVCETGDYLALGRTMPEPKPGDLLAIMTAGAYGAVQSGTYNTRALVPEVLVKDDQYAVVRPRIEVDALIAMDKSGAVAVTNVLASSRRRRGTHTPCRSRFRQLGQTPFSTSEGQAVMGPRLRGDDELRCFRGRSLRRPRFRSAHHHARGLLRSA